MIKIGCGINDNFRIVARKDMIKLEKLKYLNISGNSLTSRTVASIFFTFKYLTNIEKLNLSSKHKIVNRLWYYVTINELFLLQTKTFIKIKRIGSILYCIQ